MCALCRSIRSFLCLWMDRHPEDFKQPPSFSCLRHLIQFAEKHIPDSDIIQRAKHKLKIFSQQDEANNGPGICGKFIEIVKLIFVIIRAVLTRVQSFTMASNIIYITY